MNEEAKQVISFIYKRSGKKILPASDVYLAISMELQWCSPKQAKLFVKQAINLGLLKEEAKGVRPSFPVDTLSIPTGFSPSKECFFLNDSKEFIPKNNDLISDVISLIKEKTKMSENDIRLEIKKIAKEKLLFDTVAAMFYAKKMDCVTKKYIEKFLHDDFTSEKNKS